VIVIDASSLTKYLLKEPFWEEVERYLLEEDIYSVDHVLKEALNAVWRNCVLLKLFDEDTALEKLKVLMILLREGVIHIEPELQYLEKALHIALKHRITVYDALYIVQALELGATLLTSDKGQGEVARKEGVKHVLLII